MALMRPAPSTPVAIPNIGIVPRERYAQRMGYELATSSAGQDQLPCPSILHVAHHGTTRPHLHRFPQSSRTYVSQQWEPATKTLFDTCIFDIS